jgi:hypothetical protein
METLENKALRRICGKDLTMPNPLGLPMEAYPVHFFK